MARDQFGVTKNTAYLVQIEDLARECTADQLVADENSQEFKTMQQYGVNSVMPLVAIHVYNQRYDVIMNHATIANALKLGIKEIWVMIVEVIMDEKEEPTTSIDEIEEAKTMTIEDLAAKKFAEKHIDPMIAKDGPTEEEIAAEVEEMGITPEQMRFIKKISK